jgi:hypothetical protein
MEVFRHLQENTVVESRQASACRCTRCRAKSADGSSPRLSAFRFLFSRSENAERNEGATPSFSIAPLSSRFISWRR